MSQQESSTPVIPFTLDIDAYTVGDLEDIEELSGVSIAAVAASGTFPIKLVRAVAFVSARRSDPRLKFDDTRSWSMDQLVEAMGQRPPA